MPFQANRDWRPLSTVLADEFEAIAGSRRLDDAAGQNQSFDVTIAAEEALARHGKTGKSADDAAEQARRRFLYKLGHRLDFSALCLSGGGIRSAAVSLGVIQALADRNLLDKFNYMSTVSGGGYIGSWLSAWLKLDGSANVLSQLKEKRNNADREPRTIGHLREYSNYLTPRLGIFSADTWAAVAIVLRNILVNWLILLPAIALLVVAVKLIALGLSVPALSEASEPSSAALWIARSCIIAGILALGYKLGRLYLPADSETSAADTEGDQATVTGAQPLFLWLSLLPAVIGGFCFVWLSWHRMAPPIALRALLPASWAPGSFPAMAVFSLVVYLFATLLGGFYAWLFGPTNPGASRRYGIRPRDLVAWIAGVLAFAALISIASGTIGNRHDALAVIFGMPWFLLATMLAHTVYLLLNSSSRKGDVQREWLGRASGWHFIAGLTWIILSLIVFLGPWFYYHNVLTFLHVDSGKWLAGLTTASGLVTALLGGSGATSATGTATGRKGIAANIALAVAGPLFAVLLLILLSIVLDWPVTGLDNQCFPWDGAWGCVTWDWWRPAALCVALLVAANWFANINAFSLHAVYRNRLIRCFLGGARATSHRHPDGFTDFDWDDDLRVASLWQPPPPADEWRPFHVINMTLNVAETNNLSWQQRKAMPFSVTPLCSGNPDLGYRATAYYGDVPGPNHTTGISLGTAMAISGAAVSSNMGYHSSMSLSFLLTFFNVRLGVWLGNPRGKWFTEAGPRFAAKLLLSELFGLTTDKKPFVYLSDGGHFENLALYEMIRRRCRHIIVVDGDQDPDRGFDDLGNAVRKIWIDLGVEITFDKSALLAAEKDAKLSGLPYFAVGRIRYVSDPGVGNPQAAPEGKLLYLKPVVRGDEPAADVIAYRRANPTFPAQSTTDQWFDESQFEAYRRLGYLMMDRIIRVAPFPYNIDAPQLGQLLEAAEKINQATMTWP